ncbi:hypothetical protein RSAG8_13099, partial [Rhizoctonia solani AG-8 WAC10335]
MQHELAEADKEIESVSRVLSRTPDDDPNLPLLLACLGRAHHKRYDLLEEPDDIHKMIEYTTIVLTLTPDEDPGMPGLLHALGAAHGQRFQRLGDMEDMDKAIDFGSLALELTPDGHPDLPRQLVNLAASYKVRFQRLNERDDIDKAIQYESRALALTPNGSPAKWHLGELNDLEKAIQYKSQALELTPDSHPHLPQMLANLASSHSERFGRLGELNDLEKATQYQSRALDLTPDGHPHLSSQLANLGGSYGNRFQRLGELDDLEKATHYKSWALALTPDGHPDLAGQLGNLGGSYSNRFERLGELDDLERAIQYQSRALDLTPDGHPDLSKRLANLGVSYSNRFEHLGELDDLERAIQYKSRALDLTPDGHPHLSKWLANLGVSYSNRFQRLGELDDLERAIQYESRALDLTPDGHPDLPKWLANLGASHNYRFQCLGGLDNLEKAITFQSCALKVTADDHPHFCLTHFNLAVFLVRYYEHTNNPSHLQDSLYSFRIASKSLAGPPRDKFEHAQRWASYALTHSPLKCIEAYQTTIELLPGFIWLGATTSQRYQDLRMAETLAIDAASAAILSSNHSLALEWLEQARCVVWNQNLMLRSPLDELRASHPSLATRLQTVASQLHSAGSESRELQISSMGSKSLEQVGQEHRRLAKEYNELLTQTRTLPGFEDFLRPMKVTGLVRAARNGPIVVINCHKDRCDALLIRPFQDDVTHIPLPNFNLEKVQRACLELKMLVRNIRLSERGVGRRPLVEEGKQNEFGSVLAVLWYDVVKPVLDFLGFTVRPINSFQFNVTNPEVISLELCSTGDYDHPQSRVFDYVISSYTPTLTALLESTPRSLTCNSRVGQAATPGHSSLPGTTKELASVRSHVENKAGYSQLTDNQATPTAVLDAMEQHDWVHLACHAHQNVNDPTESGFFLHDGTLDLAAINRRSFKGKGLAFLSACQTATGDGNLPDEAVHLASVDEDAPFVADKVYSELMVEGKVGNGEAGKALHNAVAGLRGRIGEEKLTDRLILLKWFDATMWSVVDEDAPFVADKVYSELMVEGKVGNGEAGKALHNAVAGLRGRRGEEKFERWVPYIHIGS